MAEKQSGPVKPPTLDMQARKPSPRTPGKSAGAPKSEAQTAKPAPDSTTQAADTPKVPPSGAQKSDPPRPAAGSRSAQPSAPFPLIPTVLSAGIGALIAVLVVLGLATSGTLSGLMPQPADDAAERLRFAEEQVSEALVGFNALNRQVSDLQARTSETAEQLTVRQDELQAALNELPTAEPADPVDLSGIQSRIDQLDTRIAALQSGASSEDADTLSTELAEMRASLTALSEQVSGLGQSLDNTNESLLSESAVITSLQADVAALQSEPSLPSTDSQLLRLPLALSGLETALQAARPFAAELQSLLALVPALSASQELTIAAETGLPAPGRIVTDFSRAVPAIMAARPTDPDAGVMDNLMSRAQALLAIRPTGETGADPVTDTLARAEQALADRQFANAAEALSQLPEPMRQAAGDALAPISLMGEAEALLAGARATVLAASNSSGQLEQDGAAE